VNSQLTEDFLACFAEKSRGEAFVSSIVDRLELAIVRKGFAPTNLSQRANAFLVLADEKSS
jgi:hypothetical protein